MKKWAILIAETLFTLCVVVAGVRNVIANDPIHYFSDQPGRLLFVAAIAGVGAVLVWAFCRLPPAIRCGAVLLWRYAAALLVAYLVAWTGAFIYLRNSLGGSVRWDSYWFYLCLAWSSGGSGLVAEIFGNQFTHTLNHALFYSVIGFIPFAALAVVLVQKLGRRQHAA
jgi:hypothetical protein